MRTRPSACAARDALVAPRQPTPMSQQGQAAGIFTGLAHPVSGLDHVLAMVAVGLWGAQLGAPAIWLLPVTFPMVMALGGIVGLLGVPLPGVEVGIAASAILLGLAVMSALRPPLAAAVVLVAALRDFPRPRARHRAAGRPERAPLQHGLRGGHRLPARGRHRRRARPSLAMGTESAAGGGRRRGAGGDRSSCGGRSRERHHDAAAKAAGRGPLRPGPCLVPVDGGGPPRDDGPGTPL